jgi:hypothetical protein
MVPSALVSTSQISVPPVDPPEHSAEKIRPSGYVQVLQVAPSAPADSWQVTPLDWHSDLTTTPAASQHVWQLLPRASTLIEQLGVIVPQHT